MKYSLSSQLLCFSITAYAATPARPRASACTPSSLGDSSQDDVPAIQSAIASCGASGTIVIPAAQTYTIRSPLSFTGCASCDFQLEGTLQLSDDLDFWEGKTAAIEISGIQGATIRSLTGTGVVDGTGQPFWTEFAANSSYRRPTLVVIDDSSDIVVENLAFVNPPNVFHSTKASAQNVRYSGLTLSAATESDDDTQPKNTDGFDVSGTGVLIENVVVTNQDDCVAFKPSAASVTVQNITCTGSHGISVGSLGKSADSVDTVTDIFVSGATMRDSTKAVGIKLYSGGSAPVVKNVTFSDVTVDGCDYAAQIQSCYNADSDEACAESPSLAEITDVKFIGFSGTTSGDEGAVVANLNCSPKGSCGISFEDFNPTPPSSKGAAEILCSNVPDDAGITCGGTASG